MAAADTQNTTMRLLLKINDYRVIARLIGVLYKLKVLSAEYCDKTIDKMTVISLKKELLKRNPKDTLTEDFNAKSDQNQKR